MPNITDLKSLKAHAPALDAELKAVFAKYGLEYEGRNAKIGDGKLDYKIKLSYGSDEEKTDRSRKEYEMYARMLGLPQDGFGKAFIINGVPYRVVGVQPNKPKNSVKLQRVKDGKSFQCPAAYIANARQAEV